MGLTCLTNSWVSPCRRSIASSTRRRVVQNDLPHPFVGSRPRSHATPRGDKALIGNAGYRRYLRKTAAAKGQPAFEIDPGMLAEAARFDGIFVLRTNARLTPLQAVLRYRDLVRVEDLFRRAKAVMRTRPIFHSCRSSASDCRNCVCAGRGSGAGAGWR